MDIKKLITDISTHIVNIRALNENILINKYKITRGRLDSIISILVEAKIIEFVSFTEPYKILPDNKEQLIPLLTIAYEIFDRNDKKKKAKQNSIGGNNSSLTEIKETLKRIEDRLSKLEQPQKNMRLKRGR